MDHAHEIEQAIGAHGMWKARLRQAIDTGKFDTPVATVSTDNQCAFGKWLYGPTVTAQDKTSAKYKTVQTLHAAFHKVAARVAELAVAGKKAEADKLMAQGGEFASASLKLTAAMIEWKKTFTPAAVR